MNSSLSTIAGLAIASSIALAAVAQAAMQVQPAPPMPAAAPMPTPIAGRGRGPAPEQTMPVIRADQLPGKLVTLNLRDQPLRVALQQLGELAGLQFNMNGRDSTGGDPSAKAITLEVREKPVWETLLAVLKQVQADDPLNMNMGAPPYGNYYVAGRAITKGPFLIVARSVSHEVPVQPSGLNPDQASYIRLETSLVMDPSIRLSRLSQVSIPTRATDDKGNSLVPIQPLASNGGMMTFGSSGFNVPSTSILLQRPPGNVELGRKIAVVEGVFTGTITSTESLEVGAEKKAERTMGAATPGAPGVKVSIEWGPVGDLPADVGFRGRGNIANAPFGAIIRLEGDTALSAAEWNTWQTQLSSVQVKMQDAGGHVLRSIGTSSTSSARSRQMSFRFTSDAVPDNRGGMITPGDPVKIVVELPVNPKTVEIPYRFENIPLP